MPSILWMVDDASQLITIFGRLTKRIWTGYPPEALREVSKRLCQDLKEARERLNQTPENSSRPPSTRAPWTETPSETEAEEQEEEKAAEGSKDLASGDEPPKEPKVKAQTDPSVRRANPVSNRVPPAMVAPNTCRSPANWCIGPSSARRVGRCSMSTLPLWRAPAIMCSTSNGVMRRHRGSA